MNEHDPKKYKEMVISYQERGDPTGWFENIYSSAAGDHTAIFWADLEPNPYLIKWLKQYPVQQSGKKAIAIGCGVGDDAEALAKNGYEVTAFDISPSAIELCKKRYPETTVDYLGACPRIENLLRKSPFGQISRLNSLNMPNIRRI